MSASNFKTENNTYRKLIGNGLIYQIPRFQRDFSWTETEWEELWMDILETIKPNGEPAHYMGYLVLQSNDEKNFDVIDGQQRLTTLSLIVLAVLKNLQRLIEQGDNPEQNQLRLNELRSTYIGYLDPVTLIAKSKLKLNRNNDHYFQNYLIPLSTLPIRGFRLSVHNLRKAFEWFDKKVYQYLNNDSKNTDKNTNANKGVCLAQLIESMSDRLFFTVIQVTDDLNAYKVFETLNARGVRLSSTDLLKNYLFSILHRNQADEINNLSEDHYEMKILEDRWESIISRLGSESFPDFLRHHWNSRHSFVRKSELFKSIRNEINNRASVFELLRSIEEDIDIYLALTQPDARSLSQKWTKNSKENAQLLKLFRITQPLSMLMAAYRLLLIDQFDKVLYACVIISVRYNVIGNSQTNEQERIYQNTAHAIHLKNLNQVQSILTALKPIYPSDESFKSDFKEKSFKTTDSKNNKILKYILCKLENQHLKNNIEIDFENESLTIEHILPQNPETGWEQFTEDELESMVYRIGNMALLEKSKNKEIENTAYSNKRSILESSHFSLTKKLAENHPEWTTKSIISHQNLLAKLAVSVWRIDLF